MKPLLKKILCAVTAITLTAASLPVSPAFAADGAGASEFADVPADSWAVSAIAQAKEYGLMKGTDDTHFGYGANVTKAEFVTILCNMLRWQTASPDTASFSDVSKGDWYYPYIETALSHNVMDKTSAFQPKTAITREEAAVMFVRALGLSAAAKLEEASSLPFTDVKTNKGYIAAAKTVGMISGTSATTFNPTGTAKREEIASMTAKVYSSYYGKTDFLHGFYAISSYAQRSLAADMDAVTFMWSTMTLDQKGVWLNTSSENNQFSVPSGYEDIVSYLDSSNVKEHLGVYMTAAGGAKTLLTDASNRDAAVEAIIAELTKSYDELGRNPYSGVTIDFEGLKGSDAKQGLNQFLEALSSRLKSLGKTLYVAVQPVLPDGVYYDGFDYKTIGSLADKVILMAHDYNPTSLDGYVGTQWHKNAALSPIGQVYYALKALTDADTGVADKSKLVLAISFAGVGWKISDDGNLLASGPVALSPQTIAARLAESTTATGFSETYRNPYMTCTGTDGTRYFVWYENSQSVFEKAALARLFGVGGVSLWRLGTIPSESNYSVGDSYK